MPLPTDKAELLEHVHGASVELERRRRANENRGDAITAEWQAKMAKLEADWLADMAAVEAEDVKIAADARDVKRLQAWLQVMPKDQFVLPPLATADVSWPVLNPPEDDDDRTAVITAVPTDRGRET